ncbi:hypothetical protein ACOTFR_12130 [Achromobacter xylosoxidans]
MNKQPLVILEDKNSKCLSLLATITLADYFLLIDGAYKEQGGLEGQRAPITTKTGLKIRSRLVNDLKHGAVIPPIVVGAVCATAIVSQLRKLESSQDLVNLLRANKVDLSIIDGMQRTTALQDAKLNAKSTYIRIELWVAKKVDSLIYRMLVLNTGQVPWDLKRQLDTLYRPIVQKVEKSVPGARIIALDETFRRSQAGEYRSTRIIELFLAFTSRSTDVDIKERVAEEFAKIDITEATANEEFMPLFIEAMKLMISVDGAFDRANRRLAPFAEAKIKAGRDIFTSAPGSIGFMAAVAEKLLGAPGFDYDLSTAKNELKDIKADMTKLIAFLARKSDAKLAEFLDLETLNQVLTVKSSRIGEYQRNVYKKAFTVLMEKTTQVIKQNSMTPCWQAR